MKIIWLLLLVPFISFSQTRRTDSSTYYRKRVEKAYKELTDSFKRSEIFVDYVSFMKRKHSYNSLSIFATMLHSDYSTFNESIAASGFPALRPLSFGFGFGYSGKFERGIIDFYFAQINGPNHSKKGGETIQSDLVNLFQIDAGIDVVNAAGFSVYPYAGISGRMASLYYSKDGSHNSMSTNISNMFTGREQVNSISGRFGYQLGVGAEGIIATNDRKNRILLLFAKAGVNRPFGHDVYVIDGVKYNPEIKKGDLNIMLGVKFASRY